MGNRVLVGVLAAIDALVAAAVGLAAVAAPLTLLWVFGFGDAAAWGALWPAVGRVWQLGHLVPVAVALPAEYAVTAGVPTDAAAFTVSLAPLALAVFTAVFAARSGLRAAAAGAGWTGALTGGVVSTAVAVAVLLTSANPVAAVAAWQAVVLPAVVFLVPALLGALAGVWRHGDDGGLDRLRDRLGTRWAVVPGAAVRGAGLALVGLVGVAAIAVAGLVAVRGGEVIALFQAGHIDPLGATVVTLGQLGYLPTLVVWAVSFFAGPGFSLGAGTLVSPGATQLPLVPGIPVLGLIPTASTPWLLLVVLVPIALGVLAGVRMRRDLDTGVAPRLVAAGGAALVTGLAGGVVAACAAGALGPGALATVGPDGLAVGVALAAETLVGALVALLAPARGRIEQGEPPASAAASDPWRELALARGGASGAPLG